jgi:Domain of unknown function (DUF2017)
MSRFAPIGRGRVFVELTVAEAQLLDGLARQLVELLGEGIPAAAADADPLSALIELDGPVEEPDDPVLRRLLPDGRPDDADASAEFRRFTERDLREAKMGHALVVHRMLAAALGDVDENIDEPDSVTVDVELDREQTGDWMRTLTDLRLAIAERIGIQADDDRHWAALDPDDPQLMVYRVYVWLAGVLESLLEARDRKR